MQFVYLRTCVPPQSVVQIKYFLQLGSIFCRNPQKKMKKANHQKIKYRQTVLRICNLHFFDVTLCNLIAEVGQYEFLGKIDIHFTHFHLLTSSYSNEDFYIFHLPFYTFPFFLQLPSCLSISLLINHIFSWKGKLNHTAIDITCFFFKLQNLH